MKKVSSAEMAKKFSLYCDLALGEPIVVTKNGRDRLVLLGVDEFNFMKEMLRREPAEERAQTAEPAASAGRRQAR
jgi:prevent-host-death family protein